MNLRGHHGSRPVRDIGKVSLTDYVADALEVAAALKNPIVIGHSMGGLIAQKVGRSLRLETEAHLRCIAKFLQTA
jgi:pimeloyl-ACP methyl ester carboxylesterase